MSRLFKKNNSVSKIVALWLVFIMLTTPFFAHAGLKNDSKAESATPGTPTATINISAGDSDWVESNGQLNYNYNSVTQSKKYYYGVDNIKVTQDITNVNTFILEYNGSNYTYDTFDVRFIVRDDSVASLTTIDASNSDKLKEASDVTINNTNGWYLDVYIKPNCSTEGAPEGIYALCASYKFVEDNPMADYDDPTSDSDDLSPANLVDPNDSSTPWVESDWYKSVGIKNEEDSRLGFWAANPHHCAGLIRYGYAEKGSTDITWSTKLTTGGTKVTPENLQGECDIYAGVFATEDDATNNVPIAKRKIATAKIDNVAPVIEKQGLFYSEDWKNFNINDATAITADDNKVLYRDGDASKYRYYIKVADGGSPATMGICYTNGGIDASSDVPITKVDGQNIWYAENVTGVNPNFLVYFKATDESGKEHVTTNLPKIVPADTALEKFTFAWSYGQYVTGATDGAYNINKSTASSTNSGSWYTNSVTKQYITLNISGESYNEVEKIYITNGDEAINEWVNNTSGTPSPYYNISNKQLTIPKDITANADYDDLKLHIKYKNTATETVVEMSDILIDQTAPIFCANATQPENEAEIVSLADTYKADEWYKNIYSGINVYLYKGLANVDESEIIEAYYTVNGGAQTNIPNKNGGNWIGFDTNTSGTTVIELYAKDSAGNESYETITINLDKSSPSVDSLSITTPTKSENTVATVKASDDKGIVKYTLTLYYDGAAMGGKTYEYDTPQTSIEETININDAFFNNNLPEGNWSIWLYVFDVAGNYESKISDFVVDNTAPQVASVKLQRADNAQNNWTDVPTGEIDSSKTYYMNNDGTGEDKIYDYRYVVSLTDTNGVDDAAIAAGIDTNYFAFVDPDPSASSGGYFYLLVKENAVASDGVPVTPSILGVDLAGNEMDSPVTCDTKIAMVSATPTGSVTLKDADGNTVDYKSALVQAQLEAGTNKGYKAEITIKSHNPIDKIALTYGTGEIIEPDTSIGYTHSDVSKLYTYQTTITIPTYSNKKFADLKVVYQLEGDTVYTDYDSLATILYDKTAPVVTTNPENATPVAITYPTGWVQSFAVDYKITSGDGGDESLLAEASCTVDTVVNKVEDAEKLTGTISLTTSSTSVDGTKITIKAKDKAGNELPEETHYVKVDADAPAVELEVAGEASYDLTTDAPLNEIPEVYYYAEDNLTFDVVTLKIEGPDSIPKEIDLIAGIQNDEK
ncbi:MAG: hypothetical protein IJX12_06935, partial [Lachnospiraceae bacterium]|nr:hypothetical protein [Lachnospiraceae bacterium]